LQAFLDNEHWILPCDYKPTYPNSIRYPLNAENLTELYYKTTCITLFYFQVRRRLIIVPYDYGVQNFWKNIGTVLPVENAQLYRKVLASYKEERGRMEVGPCLKGWEIAPRAALEPLSDS
jgi:hypothetical protein